MKFSKIKIYSISCTIIVLLLILTGCSNNNLGYNENKVYTQKELSKYHKSEDNINVNKNLSRQEAIDKSKETIKKIFKFDVDENKLDEEVKLFNRNLETKDTTYEKKNNLFWSINWSEKKDKKTVNRYRTIIEANTGELLHVQNFDFDYQKNKYSIGNEKLSKEELEKILEPLNEGNKIDLENTQIIYYENGKIILETKENNYNVYIEIINNELVVYSRY